MYSLSKRCERTCYVFSSNLIHSISVAIITNNFIYKAGGALAFFLSTISLRFDHNAFCPTVLALSMRSVKSTLSTLMVTWELLILPIPVRPRPIILIFLYECPFVTIISLIASSSGIAS